ncbi:xanthine phosphoribosyltransferase [Apilactobacillus ozensis]|uniref:Xanthine phosphoribosyltransferase n=1 Tax=Apilactobacillus ozensis DSM 23829 = JCM 17196 TaxID=1423781 RepID=A0A0R2AMA2_9LACO|nr:xanthine phosphoribosyltransferase [Apilactobacillus ozensis]KRM68305.1 xanthine phosphoribosyltransferase [Apilactobacillus ozensis DSM 23829 = JCM 17196]MCK8607505.1 xanthine phosphoribosyltransferase [Apilactobacillus ozensis]
MKLLEERILKDGNVLSGDILKVDTFLNHQVDPQLMNSIGKEFKKLFDNENITRILTVESSGIAPAVLTGLQMNVPVVFARKHKSVTMNDNAYTSDVYSYTKKVNNHISIDKRFINADDNVLIIDDFLANGQAVNGLVDIIHQANANVSGVGIVIEKSFQDGRKKLDNEGLHVESLARISSLDNNKVTFVD